MERNKIFIIYLFSQNKAESINQDLEVAHNTVSAWEIHAGFYQCREEVYEATEHLVNNMRRNIIA